MADTVNVRWITLPRCQLWHRAVLNLFSGSLSAHCLLRLMCFQCVPCFRQPLVNHETLWDNSGGTYDIREQLPLNLNSRKCDAGVAALIQHPVIQPDDNKYFSVLDWTTESANKPLFSVTVSNPDQTICKTYNIWSDMSFVHPSTCLTTWTSNLSKLQTLIIVKCAVQQPQVTILEEGSPSLCLSCHQCCYTLDFCIDRLYLNQSCCLKNKAANHAARSTKLI